MPSDGLEKAGDLGRIDVDADQFQVAIDPPAQLRLMQPGPDREHDIGLAPQRRGRRAPIARDNAGR